MLPSKPRTGTAKGTRTWYVSYRDASNRQHDHKLGRHPSMSPELARGEVVTTATDLYSYGLLLQEIFTGQPAQLTPLLSGA